MTTPSLQPLVAPADWFMPDDADVPQGKPPAVVGPPIPAPYLAGVPQLSKEQLRALANPKHPLHREAQLLKSKIARQLFLSRHDFENRAGVKIVSEPPKRPAPGAQDDDS